MKKYIAKLNKKFSSLLSSILHASCPDMIIEVFSELYEYEVLNW